MRSWRALLVAGAAEDMRGTQSLLAGAQDALDSSSQATSTWEGAAADFARSQHARLAASLAGLLSSVASTVAALETTSAELGHVERLVDEAEALARAHGLTIGAHGVGAWDSKGYANGALASAGPDLGAVMAAIEVLVRQATVLGAEADHALAGQLSTFLRQLAGSRTYLASQPSEVVARAPTAAAVAVNADAADRAVTELDVAGMVSGWNGLAVADREHIIADHPEVVGAADGLPAWARDRANRVLLDRADVELARQEELLRPQAIGGQDGLLTGLGGVLSIGTFGGGTRRTAYEQVVAKIAAVRAVRQVLSQDDGRTRELMALDLSGRSAKVAVSIGDVDHADHVAVLVDGFTTSVQRDLAGADQAAARLDALARRQAMGWGDRGEVAVVTWMAYDAPQTADTLRSPHSVALRASAEAGAAPLASFLAGISRSGGSDRHLTLVGHSYGSTTAGLAVARGGSHIDDLVVMGSPGLGVDSAQRLGMPAARVHVLEADDDPVADLGWFGRDPDQLAGVDVLSTAAAQLPDGSTAARTSGHSSYLTGGTTSQWNVAAVVAGVPALARVRPAGR